MGKQIDTQMEQPVQSAQKPQIVFVNDNTNQTGPPYYVDLFIEAGLTAIIPFSDGNHHKIQGPDTCLLVSNKPDPPRPIMLFFENLKQIVDRNGTLRQLIIENTTNQQPQITSTCTSAYAVKQKSGKQIDSNNNNTNGSKNAPTTIYDKCSSNSIDSSQELPLPLAATSPEQHQYSSYFNCSLCYPDSYATTTEPTYPLLNSNPQLNGCPLNSSINPINHQMTTVPTPANASIYTTQLPLIDPIATSPPSINQTTYSTSSFNHSSTQQQTASKQSFNLDNLLNNQNNLLLKAAKSKLNLPINYAQFNGQTTNQFLLNGLVNSTGKLSPKQHNNSNQYQSTNSPVNGHISSGHQLIKSLQMKDGLKSHKYSVSSVDAEQSNKKSNLAYTGSSVRNSSTIRMNKTKSICSHHIYQDSYHVHANSSLDYELNEKKVRKDKYGNSSLTSNLNTLRNGVKRKDAFKGLIDKQSNRSNADSTDITTNSYKRFDEIKSSKSVDSPVTSSSPISEHYDFSSEESESAQYSTNKQSSRRSISDDISIKNTKNLNSSIAYHQPTTHLTYRSSNINKENYSKDLFPKDAFRRDEYASMKRTITNSQSNKNSKESLQEIRRTNQQNSTSNKSTSNGNTTRKKLIAEDDRDDGFGDELEYRICNVQRINKSPINSVNLISTVQKQSITSPQTIKFKQSMQSCSTKSIIAKGTTKLININNMNKKQSNHLEQPIRIRKDELITKENSKIDKKVESCSALKSDESERNQTTKLLKKSSTSSEDIKQSFEKKIEINNRLSKLGREETKKEEEKLEMKPTIAIEKERDDKIKEENSSQLVFESKTTSTIEINEKSISDTHDENINQQQIKEDKITKPVSLKQNEMPQLIAFNLIETLVTSSSVRLKWTKNNGISLTNLERPNYQIEIIYLKKEDNGQLIKCSRIAQQCSQKSCKINNLISEQEYTFRVRLVYEEQLYLSNDLVVKTHAIEKMSLSKKNKSKIQQQSIVIAREQQDANRKANEQVDMSLKSNSLIMYLNGFNVLLSSLITKFSFIGKEKFYALFYLFLFFTLCYLFAIICYTSYIH